MGQPFLGRLGIAGNSIKTFRRVAYKQKLQILNWGFTLFNTSRGYGCVLGSARLQQVQTLTVSLSVPCFPLALGCSVILFRTFFSGMTNALIMNKCGLRSGKQLLPNSHDPVVCLFPKEWKPGSQFGLIKSNCGYFCCQYKWLIKRFLTSAVAAWYKMWVSFTGVTIHYIKTEWGSGPDRTANAYKLNFPPFSCGLVLC